MRNEKKNNGRRQWKRTQTAVISAGIAFCMAWGGTTDLVYAAVEDNLDTVVLEQAVGSYEDNEDSHSLFGLLKNIIKKLGFMEQHLTERINESEAALEARIEKAGENAHAGQSLYVYLPLTDALADYDGSEVTLISPSGNQQASGKLEKTEKNYCCSIAYDFGGDCVLQWVAENAQGNEFPLTEHINLSGSSEFRLGSSVHRLNISIPKETALDSYDGKQMSLIVDTASYDALLADAGSAYRTVIYSDYDGAANLSYEFLEGDGTSFTMLEPVYLNTEIIDIEAGIQDVDPARLSWRTIRNICASGRTKLFFQPGDVLMKGTEKWHIVEVEANTIKVWNQSLSDGYYNMSWEEANAYSVNAWKKWNENHPDFGMTAVASELMSKSESELIADDDRSVGMSLEHEGFYYHGTISNVQGRNMYPHYYWLNDAANKDASAHYVYVPRTPEYKSTSNVKTINSASNTVNCLVYQFAYYGLWLGELPEKRVESADYSMDEISEICKLGLADDYDLTIVGTELFDDWHVIGSQKDGDKDCLWLWKKQNVGNSAWGAANTTAEGYFNTFNSMYGTSCAYASGLLTKSDIDTGWLAENKTLGFHWWTGTAGNSNGTYVRVLNNGEVVETVSRNLTGCTPAVWIR